MYRIYFVLIVIIASITSAFSQENNAEMMDSIKLIEISSTRFNTGLLNTPLSVTKIEAKGVDKPMLSIQELLFKSPGIFSLNPHNYAQDLRISIRGFGARSAFGIRGVKLMVDGIPETTPDGQGQIDNLMLSDIEKIEIIRGPSANMYGNASGGVIHISSLDSDENYVSTNSSFGSNGLEIISVASNISLKKTKFALHLNSMQTDGYREHSQSETNQIQGHIRHEFASKDKLHFQIGYTDSPISNDPGGVNIDQYENSPKTARDRNILFDAGESIQQWKTGLSFKKHINELTQLNAFSYISGRTFEGKLPFEDGGWIQLSRLYGGMGINYETKTIFDQAVFTWQSGIEYHNQSDDRSRFANLEGIQGNLSLDQQESFRNFSIFHLQKLDYNLFSFEAGIRYDINEIELVDRYTLDGIDSGSTTLSNFSPSIGINYRIQQDLQLYTNFRTGFETPTLSEIGNSPSLGFGFNEELVASKSINYELGLRSLKHSVLNWDIVLFNTHTSNELIPYELEAFPSRLFYRNAGETKRTGIEIQTNSEFNRFLSLETNYSFSNFTFGSYTVDNISLEGNYLAGIPKHNLSLSSKIKPIKSFTAVVQWLYNTSIFVNDENSITTEAIHRFNAKLQFDNTAIKQCRVSFILGLYNLTNQLYPDNIRLNAFGNRFYEAGPQFQYQLNLRLTYFFKDKTEAQ